MNTNLDRTKEGKYAPISESGIIQRQKRYGFKVDKWITIREKNMFGML